MMTKNPCLAEKPVHSIIIPAYNEEAGLPVVLEKVFEVINSTFEVVVVDDGSSDRTREEAERYPCVLVCHEANRGKGEAMRTGIRHARGENIVFIDADGTYPVEAILEIAAALEEYDMVVASRATGRNNIPAFNRIGNATLRHTIRQLYGFRANDPLTGLYGLKKSHLEKMTLHSGGFGIESEIALKAASQGLQIKDIPITYQERIGEAKLNGLQDGYRILRTILSHLSLYNPTLLFIIPGIALFSLGLLLMAALYSQPLEFRGLWLGDHTFALGSLAALAGSQIAMSGLAVKLYALNYKYTTPDLLTRLFSRKHTAKFILAFSLTLIVAGIILGGELIHSWFASGHGAFTRTKEAILVSFLVVQGLQLAFSSSFLSLFQRELSYKTEMNLEVDQEDSSQEMPE